MIRTNNFLLLCVPLLAFLLGTLLTTLVSARPAPVLPSAVESGRAADKSKSNMPRTGERLPAMDGFDEEFSKFLEHWKIPGASVAIVYKGKLVFARGYGYANTASKTPVKPDSLFRTCSISKLLTSVAILKLIEDGKLTFETAAFPLLKLPVEKEPSRRPDVRINSITIRNLLECSAGWNRKSQGDPMFSPIIQDAAREYSNTLRPTARAVIRYEYGHNLDFTPGTQFCYSNFEYAVLGEIISIVSGQKYEDYVREKILAPMGITAMIPGKTRQTAPGEVTYYPFLGESVGTSLFPNVRGPLPLEYGGDFCLEAMTADCGWLGSTIDMARFVSAVFGDCGPKLQPVSPEMARIMVSRPALECWRGKDTYFALGWEIENASSKDDFVAKKEGCLPGAETLVAHHQDGTTIAFAYNNRPFGYADFQVESFKLLEKTWKARKYVSSAQSPQRPG
jgi:CubicO group peptidase (beta-lactamase class C family)